MPLQANTSSLIGEIFKVSPVKFEEHKDQDYKKPDKKDKKKKKPEESKASGDVSQRPRG